MQLSLAWLGLALPSPAQLSLKVTGQSASVAAGSSFAYAFPPALAAASSPAAADCSPSAACCSLSFAGYSPAVAAGGYCPAAAVAAVGYSLSADYPSAAVGASAAGGASS